MFAHALIRSVRRPLARACALIAVTATAIGLTAAAGPALAVSRPAMRAACPAVPGHARCYVLYREQAAVNRAIAIGDRSARPSGLTPQDLWSAYRLPFWLDSDQTVAVSIAYNTPHLAQYLAHYRSFFGLPPCGQGCLRIVNQRGHSSPLPQSGAGSGWDLEATLDVSMISVACPRCHILVVEANSDSFGDLAATDDTAARLGAQVISNSYGTQEDGYVMTFAKSYDHPGHTIVVAAGDAGFGEANFPADLSTVTAVGGTQLLPSSDARGWSERVWNQPDTYGGAGASGCSAYVAKPAWQHDPHCPGRTIADISAVASNIPIYNKFWGGWVTVGGTSVAAPLIAGIYGLAGNAASLPPGSLYQHRQDLFDITVGNNAFLTAPRQTCGDDYMCVAKKGYDAPTGLGTPDGIGAF
jgi:subtilase family serine protease